jgi:catechol 2,3-dioxygenase-like lactoylglutathione lyase family enzyme
LDVSGTPVQEKSNTMAITLGNVAHFSLAVTDPKASAEWWLSLFDLEERARSASRVLLRNDAIAISLIEGAPDPAALTHMAFRTRDMASLKSARDSLRDKGVALEDPGNEIGPVAEGSASLGIWFRDNDGYRWELFLAAEDIA